MVSLCIALSDNAVERKNENGHEQRNKQNNPKNKSSVSFVDEFCPAKLSDSAIDG